MSTPEPVSPRPRPPGTALYALYLLALGVTLAANPAIREGARGGWLPDILLTPALLVAIGVAIASRRYQ